MPKSEENPLLNAFSGTVAPTRVSPLYQAGLALVALTMILLPLIYVGLIAAVGWLVAWHIQNDIGIFSEVRGRATIIALVLYLGPAVAGVIFVLFLIKPLFSGGGKPPPNYKINEADEPLLFAFVSKICALVGAPEPKEIRLDTQVNASAGFRRGWLSFLSNDLVLVIGLPLAAGMTSRQLAGVLAHEFGHFAQGAGMRFSYVIRSVNHWFARVVYQRDGWDERLEEWGRTDNLWVNLVFKLAQGGVWLGRKVLWCLMQVGHFISCFMSRQMEFDADSYEAKMAGSEEFAHTAARLRALGLAHGAAMDDAYQVYQAKALPEDLPALVAWREARMPDETRANLEKQVAESRTRWNETHPADPDRVKAVLALKAEGVFREATPASMLFADFPATCKAVTRHYFEHEQAISLDKIQFHSMERFVADRTAADDSDKNLDTFYLKDCFHFLRIRPLSLEPPEAWRPAFATMAETAEIYRKNLAMFAQRQGEQHSQTLGRDLVEANFKLTEPTVFSLDSSTPGIIEATLKQTQQMIQNLSEAMATFESAASIRLGAALRRGLENLAPDQKPRAAHLLAAQQALAAVISYLMLANTARRSLQLYFDNAANHPDGALLETQARKVAERIQVAARHAVATLGDAAHPYLDGHPPIASVLHLPADGDHEFARAFKLAHVCTDALVPLFVRVMGDLCGLALEAEKQLATEFPPEWKPAQETPAVTPTDSASAPGLSTPAAGLGLPPPSLAAPEKDL